MINIQLMNEQDFDFFTDMLYESFYIPENKPSKEVLLTSSQLKKYSESWGREGDRAIIAYTNEGNPIGAAWYRLFTKENQGYGYIDEQTPELGIAISSEGRGKGVGTILMKSLIKSANDDGFSSLSLSVDPENLTALHLYQKLGFQKCGESGTSWTMVLAINRPHLR